MIANALEDHDDKEHRGEWRANCNCEQLIVCEWPCSPGMRLVLIAGTSLPMLIRPECGAITDLPDKQLYPMGECVKGGKGEAFTWLGGQCQAKPSPKALAAHPSKRCLSIIDLNTNAYSE